jgi:hypothetical protein
MSREEQLRAGAKAATGDETIIDVAEFQPKGTAGATMAGAAAGSAAGGDSTWGSAIGVGVGATLGQAIRAETSELPRLICVAVSPTEVYLLRIPIGLLHGKYDELEPIAKIHRDRLGVEVHQRATVRVVILEDLDTGHRFEMEVPRLNFYHAKALIELLMMSEEHHDDEEAEEAATEA